MARKQREKRRPCGALGPIDLAGMPGWIRREQAKGRGPASAKCRGDMNRRVISERGVGRFEVSHHATKGFRVRNWLREKDDA